MASSEVSSLARGTPATVAPRIPSPDANADPSPSVRAEPAPLGQERRSHSLRHRDGLRRGARAARGPAHAGKRVEILVEHVVAAAPETPPPAAAPGSSPRTRPPGGRHRRLRRVRGDGGDGGDEIRHRVVQRPVPAFVEEPRGGRPGERRRELRDVVQRRQIGRRVPGVLPGTSPRNIAADASRRDAAAATIASAVETTTAPSRPHGSGPAADLAPTRPAFAAAAAAAGRCRQAQRAHGTGARGELEHLAEHPGALDQRRGTVSGIPGVPVDPGPSPAPPRTVPRAPRGSDLAPISAP